jgi:hypothetical protein
MLGSLPSKQSLRNLATALVLSLPIASLTVQNALAQQQDLVFTLINKTNATLSEFYASPTGVDNWEEDILGQDVLNVGESASITISDGRETCVYDIKGVFADGDSAEQYKVNLCETETYEFYNQ